jgi:hypothetical protein
VAKASPQAIEPKDGGAIAQEHDAKVRDWELFSAVQNSLFGMRRHNFGKEHCLRRIFACMQIKPLSGSVLTSSAILGVLL